ncbi:MAG: threonine synthase [Xanthomonadales bacterium]|nr:threonine synthase [Xanthomonadales bacterium]
MSMNGYKCVACSVVQSPGFEGFLCPACGGNLDVSYDYDEAASKIDGRFAEGSNDLFRFAALLPLKWPRSPFPLRVGGTPLYPVRPLEELKGMCNLYLKDETLNPSASLKDRASAVTVGRALDVGAGVVAVASTGNAGSSLACLAAATGLVSVVFVPASAPEAKLTQMLAFGARVMAVNGTYDDAYDLCTAACTEFGWFNRSTGYNAFTREGKKTCAYEIWQDLGGRVPDRVMVSTGDGNTLSAIWKGWCDLKAVGLIDSLPKIDCVQSQASAAINDTIQQVRSVDDVVVDWSRLVVREVSASTVADSISVDRPRDGLAAVKAVIQSGGEAITVSDQEILAAIPEMAQLTGVFAEPAAAAPWAGLKHLLKNQMVAREELVVCIVSGSGLKDISSASKEVGQPCLIEPSLKAVKESHPPLDVLVPCNQV